MCGFLYFILLGKYTGKDTDTSKQHNPARSQNAWAFDQHFYNTTPRPLLPLGESER